MTRCLFCKAPSGTSKSVEHIIPESFGSKRVVLPKGIVCDKCNNYFSHKVEGPLLSHESFRNIRAWHQVPNKKGNLPSVKGYIGGTNIKINLRLNDAGKLDVQFENESDKRKYGPDFIPGLLATGLSALIFTIHEDHPKYEMSRFLAKMALEALAYRYLEKEHFVNHLIDEPHFDTIRNFARFGTGPKNWPYSQRRIFPVETLMKHPDTNEWVQAGFGQDLFITKRKETFFAFMLYGMEYVINVGGPSVKGYDEWLENNNNISPMIERNGAKVIKQEHAGKIKYFIDGKLDLNRGVEFDKFNL